MEELMFPKFDYYLDESDPDIVILRRQDGSFVAAFSARGATKEGIVEAAREDYWELVQAHANTPTQKIQQRLSSNLTTSPIRFFDVRADPNPRLKCVGLASFESLHC